LRVHLLPLLLDGPYGGEENAADDDRGKHSGAFSCTSSRPAVVTVLGAAAQTASTTNGGAWLGVAGIPADVGGADITHGLDVAVDGGSGIVASGRFCSNGRCWRRRRGGCRLRARLAKFVVGAARHAWPEAVREELASGAGLELVVVEARHMAVHDARRRPRVRGTRMAAEGAAARAGKPQD